MEYLYLSLCLFVSAAFRYNCRSAKVVRAMTIIVITCRLMYLVIRQLATNLEFNLNKYLHDLVQTTCQETNRFY